MLLEDHEVNGGAPVLYSCYADQVVSTCVPGHYWGELHVKVHWTCLSKHICSSFVSHEVCGIIKVLQLSGFIVHNLVITKHKGVLEKDFSG